MASEVIGDFHVPYGATVGIGRILGPMTSRKVRLALAGLGSVSQRGILPHLAQADALERVELVACCDVVPGRAQETAKRFGWQLPFEDYGDMLARADVDAVLIATPIPAHFEQSMQAQELGRHVYVQKARSTALAEAYLCLARVDKQVFSLGS